MPRLPLSADRHIMPPMTRASATACFDRIGPLRHAGVWLFVALLLLVAAERRLAEAHFNLRTAATGIESEDSLDADEIRTRLILLQDDKVPTVWAVSEPVSPLPAPCSRLPVEIVLRSPAPRGPPARSSSFA